MLIINPFRGVTAKSLFFILNYFILTDNFDNILFYQYNNQSVLQDMK
ncbi:hypothetical protein KIS1582_3706 [Cytobacillus firmus]|uniref:Uncharacterized protein n=1 Tax=Cytobacillus firmus TaxID=1399 RepID=A0A800N9E8_CYTFI|nr:hypothetical protein KIS1582_3706 [Cytobacillus firmus]